MVEAVGSIAPISEEYVGIANELQDRILALIPDHPNIMQLKDPWGLFKIPEFRCNDLGPSFSQASWALASAQKIWSKQRDNQGPGKGR